MLIAALSTITKLWKEPKCPSTDEWMKKMLYVYVMEYYSAIKKNESLSFATKWMELESIILSEIGQRKTNTIGFTHMWNLRNKTDGHSGRRKRGEGGKP